MVFDRRLRLCGSRKRPKLEYNLRLIIYHWTRRVIYFLTAVGSNPWTLHLYQAALQLTAWKTIKAARGFFLAPSRM